MTDLYYDAETLIEAIGLLDMGDRSGMKKLRELLKGKLAEIHQYEEYVNEQVLAYEDGISEGQRSL